MSDYIGVEPLIRKVTARQATQAFVTIPNDTKSFQMAAYNSAASIKFSFKTNTVSTGLTNFMVPPKTIFKQENIYIASRLLYLSVTNVATTPISLIFWR